MELLIVYADLKLRDMEYNDLYAFRNSNYGKHSNMLCRHVHVATHKLVYTYAPPTLLTSNVTRYDCKLIYTVAHGKTKQTLLNISENPAYDSATSSQEQLRPHSVGNAYIDSSVVMERNRLEHTYESLSDYHVHAVNVEVHGPDSEQ